MTKLSLNLEEMKMAGVELYDGMVVKVPLRKDYVINIEELYADMVDHKYRLYNTNRDTIVFYDGKAQRRTISVFPYVEEAVRVLEDEKFVLWDSLWVPFSNYDYPLAEEEQWKSIVSHYQRSWALQSRRSECLAQAKDLGVRKISKVVLRDYCIKIPERMIKVYNHSYDAYGWLKPRIRENLDFDVSLLGTYNVINGICEFIDADGDNYLSKSCGIVEELKKHGFRQVGYDVRLANSEETICEESLKHRWKKMPLILETA